MSSPQEIATAFIQHYYATLGTNPDALAGLYVRHFPQHPRHHTTARLNGTRVAHAARSSPLFQTDTSTFTMEGNMHTGPAAIVAAIKVSFFVSVTSTTIACVR